MYKILGIQTFKSKKNGKDYVLLHVQSKNPMPSNLGTGHQVETILLDVGSVDIPQIVVGDSVSVYYNKSGFVTTIIKG